MIENRKIAFVTGATGQDGSYLIELLLSKGYEVHGLVRRTSTLNRERLEYLVRSWEDVHKKYGGRNVQLHYGDLTDVSSLTHVLKKVQPDEVYNLGAQSHVGISFEMPSYTFETVALGTLRLMEAIRTLAIPAKIYQASSSEMFGNAPAPQNEKTSFQPRSPYGIAKVAAYHFVKHYREAYGMFCANGILFNHESPRRGEKFVTRKVTLGVAEILAGIRDYITLGNLDAQRDWGFAPEYVFAMHQMLQEDTPDDFVIATGETHSVRELVREAFGLVGIVDWQKYVRTDPYYMRPQDVELLCGNASKAKQKLGWEPKVKFKELVKIILEADLARYGLKRYLTN